MEPRAAPAKPFKVEERPEKAQIGNYEQFTRGGAQAQVFNAGNSRMTLPDPDEPPDELDFDPDEPNAAPARPFRVEESPVMVALDIFWRRSQISLNDHLNHRLMIPS